MQVYNTCYNTVLVKYIQSRFSYSVACLAQFYCAFISLEFINSPAMKGQLIWSHAAGKRLRESDSDSNWIWSDKAHKTSLCRRARLGDPLIEHINCQQFSGYRSNYAVFPGDSFALITPRHRLMENSKAPHTFPLFFMASRCHGSTANLYELILYQLAALSKTTIPSWRCFTLVVYCKYASQPYHIVLQN